MAKAVEKIVQVGIMQKEFSTITPEDELTFTVDELTLVHIRSEESLMFPIRAIFYRQVPLIAGCSVDKFCSCYGETCDTIYLPPGEYVYEFCDDGAAKYNPDGIFDVSIVLEPVSNAFALAEQLNANC